AAEPVDDRRPDRLHEQQRAQNGDDGACRDGGRLHDAARRQGRGRGQEDRHQQGNDQRERSGRHHPCTGCRPGSSGSSVAVRLCVCTARESNKAVTVAPTTTSVSVSAWTTGSTAGVPTGTLANTGAPAPA